MPTDLPMPDELGDTLTDYRHALQVARQAIQAAREALDTMPGIVSATDYVYWPGTDYARAKMQTIDMELHMMQLVVSRHPYSYPHEDVPSQAR